MYLTSYAVIVYVVCEDYYNLYT